MANGDLTSPDAGQFPKCWNLISFSPHLKPGREFVIVPRRTLSDRRRVMGQTDDYELPEFLSLTGARGRTVNLRSQGEPGEHCQLRVDKSVIKRPGDRVTVVPSSAGRYRRSRVIGT